MWHFFEKRPYLGEKKLANFAHSTSTTIDTAPLSSRAEGYLGRPLPIAGMAIAKRNSTGVRLAE